MDGETMDRSHDRTMGKAERTLSALIGDPEGRLTGKAKAVAENAADTAARAKHAAAGGVGRAGDFARRRPYTALALAAAAGMVLGHILGAQRPTVIVVRAPH